MIDFDKIAMTTGASSNKLLLEDDDSFLLPILGGAGENSASKSVAHGQTNDKLLFQVEAYSNTSGAVIDPVILPWQSNDGRLALFARVGSTSLTVVAIHFDASGLGDPARLINFSYRVLIP